MIYRKISPYVFLFLLEFGVISSYSMELEDADVKKSQLLSVVYSGKFATFFDKVKDVFAKGSHSHVVSNFKVITDEGISLKLETVRYYLNSGEWEKAGLTLVNITVDEKKNCEYYNQILLEDNSLIPIFRFSSQTYKDAISSYAYFPKEISNSTYGISTIYDQKKIHYLLAYSARFNNPFAFYHLSGIYSQFSVKELEIGGETIPVAQRLEGKYKELFLALLKEESQPQFILALCHLYLGNVEEANKKLSENGKYKNNKYKYTQEFQSAILSQDVPDGLRRLLIKLENREKKSYKTEEKIEKITFVKKQVQFELADTLPDSQEAFDLYAQSKTGKGYCQMARMLSRKGDEIDVRGMSVEALYSEAIRQNMLTAVYELGFFFQRIRKTKDAIDLYDRLSKWDERSIYCNAKLHEEIGSIEKARELYKNSGYLMGYTDAIRLSVNREDREFLENELNTSYRDHFYKIYQIAFGEVK